MDFVHRHSAARICLQLGHAGRKGSVRLPWEGNDVPLTEGGWDADRAVRGSLRAAAADPRAMTRDDLDRVCADFVRGDRDGAWRPASTCSNCTARTGICSRASSRRSSNQRTDEYGGSLENRLRFPLEVFAAMRAVWPAERPMSVRISATDWVEDGLTGVDAVVVARAFVAAGVDIVHVSTGQTSVDAAPVYGRMYQTPFSDQIRNDAGVPTIAVGNITEPDQVNSIIAAGRANLCALARPHLTDPFWTLRAAAGFRYAGQVWPPQYLTGRRQLERELERKAATP